MTRPIRVVIVDDSMFMRAAIKKTLETASESEGKPIPENILATIQDSYREHCSAWKDEKKTLGRWFKDLSNKIIEDEASKVALARYYTEICRESSELESSRERQGEAKNLCEEIAQKLSLPPTRAAQVVEPTKQ